MSKIWQITLNKTTCTIWTLCIGHCVTNMNGGGSKSPQIHKSQGEKKGHQTWDKSRCSCNCVCEVHYKTQLIKSIIWQRNEFKIYTMPIQNTLFIYTHTKKEKEKKKKFIIFFLPWYAWNNKTKQKIYKKINNIWNRNNNDVKHEDTKNKLLVQ